MEELIREGALKLLTSEVSCDVILSCRGYKLMAHKVILSIASPVLQKILLQDDTVPTVIIFPDISEDIMSLILDYIYTGNVNVKSDIIAEFLSIANELKLRVNTEIFKMSPKYKSDTMDELDTESKTDSIADDNKYKCNNLNSITNKKPINSSKYENEKLTKKAFKKIPALLPISTIKRRKILYNHVVPGPWCPRGAPILPDPKENRCSSLTLCDQYKNEIVQNDSNNNLNIRFTKSTSPPFRETSTNNKRSSTTGKQHTPQFLPLDQCSSESDFTQNYSSDSVVNSGISLPLNMKKKLTNAHEQNIDRNSKVLKTKTNYTDAEENDESQHVNECESINLRTNDNKKPFNCRDCGKSFSQLRNYKYHRSIHEGTKEFSARCPECGKTFNDRGYLSSHMKIHRDRKEYGCPHCPKRFNQRVAYNMHLRIHTGIKPHECPTCGKTFSRKMLLKQHQRVHTGERPYSCPECGKSFADRSNMSLHARLHTGVKPYTCNLCSKSFTKKHHLKTHMNFHTGLKPYSCQKCGLSFSQSSNMRTHYKKCILKPAENSENENT